MSTHLCALEKLHMGAEKNQLFDINDRHFFF